MFTCKTGSEIEDLIPVDLIIDSFDRLFRGEDRLEVNAIDKNAPIVPQLEKFAEDNQIALEIGWKVELCKKVKQKLEFDVSDDLENKWKNLFGKLQ